MKNFLRFFCFLPVFLYCCLPLTAQSQYDVPFNSYGGYWQPIYNQSYLNYSNRLWANPLTAYNPYQNRIAFINPSQGWQAPYLQQNNQYQIGPYGNININFGYPRLVSAYSSGNNSYISPYYSSHYSNGFPENSYDGPSTYFHLLPDYFMMNDPYTLAQQAKRDLNEN